MALHPEYKFYAENANALAAAVAKIDAGEGLSALKGYHAVDSILLDELIRLAEGLEISAGFIQGAQVNIHVPKNVGKKRRRDEPSEEEDE